MSAPDDTSPPEQPANAGCGAADCSRLPETPETDREAMDGCYNLYGSRIYLQSWDYRKTLDGEVVPIDFARTLERERNELREALRKLDAIYRRDLDDPPPRPAWLSKHLPENDQTQATT